MAPHPANPRLTPLILLLTRAVITAIENAADRKD